ncbi:hypothetical protein NE237_005463 [Protea cynaroides]|uniref:Uncharacterized protein n=1 Tax=Protea cynaroides TaxID=273540 RepID=A0A9Q0KKX0_9MAGN|nr:hypothetical protein NE237_005463 [Protea cynaroides]
MKRLFRLVFSLVLLIVIDCTLSSRTMLRWSFSSLQLDHSVSLEPSVQAQPSNSTLLQFAAIEFNEAKEKKDIELLLQGNFGSSGRYPSITSWQRRRSNEYYRIWSEFRKPLHDWSLNRRFEPEIILDLIKLVKNPVDRHYGLPDSNDRYGSCAVVGNSGILLKTEYGELIDRHDFVIRLNNAWTKGFESHVGSKTNLSFVNSNILHFCARRPNCYCHPYGGKVPLIMYICQPVHFLDYTICNSSHSAPLLITDARFDNLCARIVKYYSAKRFVEETGKSLEDWGSAHDAVEFHYSSGMQAIMLALGICEKVSIFGFGKSAEATHHYHTKQKAELDLHDYAAEYAFYNDLIEKPQVIPFLPDKFKVPPVIVYH